MAGPRAPAGARILEARGDSEELSGRWAPASEPAIGRRAHEADVDLVRGERIGSLGWRPRCRGLEAQRDLETGGLGDVGDDRLEERSR